MKYSVLMSVYAKENPGYLWESIESMLHQTVPSDDFVIVCDGQLTEELYQVLHFQAEKNPCIHLIYEKENRGLACALKIGLEYCKHEIVARMDSDDLAFPDRMERQLAVFHQQKVDIVSGAVLEFTGDISHTKALRQRPRTQEEILKSSRRRNPFNHPCTTFRKSKVLEAGNYQECPWFEDYYLWLRMLKKGCKGYNIQEPVLYMRAGEDMYDRRGGASYVSQAVRFRWRVYREGCCGLWDFLIAAGAHVVFGLVPNGFRMRLYKKFLRK